MQRISLTPRSTTEVARTAARVIREGGIVLHPTDTVYGLAGDATNGDVSRRIARLKHRTEDMPLIVLMADRTMFSDWMGALTERQVLIVDHCAPGPVTFILPAAPRAKRDIAGTADTIAVRIPDHAFTVAMCREAGLPLFSTSANVHGAPAPPGIDAVAPEIAHGVDLVVDGPCGGRSVSTIVDVTGATPRIVREGALSRSELEQRIGFSIL